MSKKGIRIGAGIAAAAVLLIAGVAAIGNSPSGGTEPAAASTTKPTTSATPTPTPTSTTNCSAEFVQKTPDRGAIGRFVMSGIKDDKEAEALLGHDATSLEAAANAAGIESPKAPDLMTTDKTCLSTEGQKVYYEVMGVLTAKGTTVNNNDQVPSNYTNSGVSNGSQVVYAGAPGITGNRSATSWTWTSPDGKTHIIYVMHRCGNWPVISVLAIYTTGTTDNPQPTPTPQCPPSMPNGYYDEQLGKLVCKTGAEGYDPGTTGHSGASQYGGDQPGGSQTSVSNQPASPPAAGNPPAQYTAPPAPAPAPAPAPPKSDPGPAPAPVPTKNPAPAPAPEPSTPPVPSPQPSCTPPPGFPPSYCS